MKTYLKRILYTTILISVFSILWLTILYKTNSNYYFTKNTMMDGKIKSGNLSTDYSIPTALSDIKKLGLNTVNVPVVINIDSLSSSDMSIDQNSLERAIEMIKILKQDHINVILEPYPWIKNGSLAESSWKPTDLNAFFWNWKTKVLHVLIKDIAEPYDVDALIISSNMAALEPSESYWLDTISYVRNSYDGLVTYKTSWWYTSSWDKKTIQDYNKKLNNKLFSQLDFISVGAYFELSDKPTNTVDNLVKTLTKTQVLNRNQNVAKELENFNAKWDKPVYFAELGFPNYDFAAEHPWNPAPSTIKNQQEQANCFEAYRRVFEKENWVLGFSVFAIGEHGVDKHYLPSSESVKVIRQWYAPAVSPIR